MGVAAVLADDQLRREGAQQRGHERGEGPQPRSVAGARGHGQVDRVPPRRRAPEIPGVPGAGEERLPGLVDRDRHDPRLVPERPLDAVTVVRVDVDVGDPLGPGGEGGVDRRGGVVVDAEARGVIGHRVVHPAGEVDRVVRLAPPHRECALHAPGDDARRSLVHPAEDRVVLVAQTVVEVELTGRRAPSDRRDVLRGVREREHLVAGRLGRDQPDLGQVEQAQLPGEGEGGLQAQRRHRVLRAEVVTQHRGGPHHARVHGLPYRRVVPQWTPCGRWRPYRRDRRRGR